jgi:oligogalacturonide transporter
MAVSGEPPTTRTAERREVTTLQKLVYGTGELFNSTSVVIILMLYLKFLTDVVGLAPFWAGLCVVIGKAWDAICDPFIGSLSDRTRSRYGRRRVYFLLFAVPASLSFASMWLHLELGSTWATALYYALAYAGFKTLSSLLVVPYQALGPELAHGYDERTSVVMYRMVFTPVGAIVAGVLPSVVVRHYERAGAPGTGHLVVSLVFGAVYVAIWLGIFAALRERPATVEAPARTPLLRAVRLALRNRSFRLLVALYLCAFFAVDVLTASTKYYVDEYLGRPELMPVVMGSMLGTAMASLPVYFWTIRRFDRRRAYLAGAAFWVVGLLLLFALTPQTPVWAVLGAMAVNGVGLGAAFITPWSMVPEVIDVDAAITGRSDEGVYTGIMTFLRQATTSVAIFAIASSLALFGYQPPSALGGAGQAEAALAAIRAFTALVPLAAVAASFAVAWRYPVTRRAHGLIRRRLDGERLAGAEAAELDALLEGAYGRARTRGE